MRRLVGFAVFVLLWYLAASHPAPSWGATFQPKLSVVAGTPVVCVTRAEHAAWTATDPGRLTGWAGLYLWDTREILLSPQTCSWLRSPRYRFDGVRVLAHEIAHAAGTVDERETECRGVSSMVSVAAALGVSVDARRVGALRAEVCS